MALWNTVRPTIIRLCQGVLANGEYGETVSSESSGVSDVVRMCLYGQWSWAGKSDEKW